MIFGAGNVNSGRISRGLPQCLEDCSGERERARELRNGRGRRQKRGDKLNSIVFLGGIGHFEEGKKEGGNEGDSKGDEGERGGAD